MESADGSKLDYEKIDSEFRVLVDAWKATWARIGHIGRGAGPQARLYERMKPHFSPERIEARKPEEEAHKKVIDYAATALIIATRVNEFDRVMQIIDLGAGFSGVDGVFITEFMEDLLREVASRLVKDPNREIGDMITDCRANIGTIVTFGIKDPSTGSG